MKYIHLICFFATMLLFDVSAYAQDGKNKDPLEITADHSLEWDRNNKVFTANTNAVAKQGDVKISADTLKAYYREENGKSMELFKLVAQGDVQINSKKSIAYGDNVEYDVDSAHAVMTGKNLKMVSEDQTLTARDTFEYWVEEGRLVANGSARIIRPKANKSGKDILDAQSITAIMKEDKQGKRVLDTLTAQNAVKITTPTEVLTGNKGVYKAARNIAEITGDVKITRGKNILQGEKATVDLNTNISRMFGNTGTGGIKRVRGVFYPGSQKNTDKGASSSSSSQAASPNGAKKQPAAGTAAMRNETPDKAVEINESVLNGVARVQAKRPVSGIIRPLQPSNTNKNPQVEINTDTLDTSASTPNLIKVPGNTAPIPRLLTSPNTTAKEVEQKKKEIIRLIPPEIKKEQE